MATVSLDFGITGAFEAATWSSEGAGNHQMEKTHLSHTDDSDWLRQSRDRDLQLDLLSVGLTVDLLFATFFLQRKFE